MADLKWRSRVALVGALALAACSGNGPSFNSPGLLGDVPAAKEGAEKQASAVPAQSGAPCRPCTIVGFRNANVTLFKNVIGEEAQRVPKSSIPVPIIGTATDGASDRLQIMTLDGIRWVSSAEVELELPRSR